MVATSSHLSSFLAVSGYMCTTCGQHTTLAEATSLGHARETLEIVQSYKHRNIPAPPPSPVVQNAELVFADSGSDASDAMDVDTPEFGLDGESVGTASTTEVASANDEDDDEDDDDVLWAAYKAYHLK